MPEEVLEGIAEGFVEESGAVFGEVFPAEMQENDLA